ncbi:MAG: radical SAM family heme chaperone HemW [Aquificaceae bacterium]|nr:radical SAM family heme chaperone HemW [Aquificaceae bacterium]
MVKALYFHIPFCSYKCPYCDFTSFVEPSADYKAYLNLLLKELELYANLSFQVKTIYFGGGTPSLIKPELYQWFLKRLSTLVPLSEVEEITIECNPENYGLEEYKKLRDIGFNRVSVGVQSLREEGLRALGRLHSVEDALKSLDYAHRAGFDNLNADFIYGYSGQGIEELKQELELLAELPLSHVSFYLLTPYEDTQFGHLYQKGLFKLPDEDTIADMFELIADRLESLGFVHYEVSNFSKPGYECKHNMFYWTQEEFLGLGTSAWSFVGDVRFGNTKNIKLYAEKVMAGIRPVEQEERLQDLEKLYDYIFVALRTKKGVDKRLLGELPESFLELFEEDHGRLRLNRKGMLLINEVLLSLRDLILYR